MRSKDRKEKRFDIRRGVRSDRERGEEWIGLR